MLGYLDIWYFRTPPSHRNTLLHMSITDYLFQISRKNSSCFLFEQKHPKWPIIEVFGILFFNFLENGLNWKTWHFLGKLSWTCVEQKKMMKWFYHFDQSSFLDQSHCRILLKEISRKGTYWIIFDFLHWVRHFRKTQNDAMIHSFWYAPSSLPNYTNL